MPPGAGGAGRGRRCGQPLSSQPDDAGAGDGVELVLVLVLVLVDFSEDPDFSLDPELSDEPVPDDPVEPFAVLDPSVFDLPDSRLSVR